MALHAFDDFKMTAKRFGALMPHEKTEMALLLQERLAEGGSRILLDDCIAVHAGKVHAYELPSVGGESLVPKDVAGKLAGETRTTGSWSKLAISLLSAIDQADDGVLKATRSEICARFSVTVSVADRTMGGLIQDGLVRRWGKSSHWALTDLGRALVADLAARAGR
ncbi:hypothetical protein NBH20_01535 [Rhizobium sp. S153]|uniref:HTH marR-type domain-containing protein n=1 Tax=Ciceribacter sichuanensis TaxID=2949647 RepID=A0ABT0V1R5_9HYPH|nr:hypothetical protein [Ciceribacter sp. S153]MCM2399824.1 hypothetical protein [Ciceribacter sp. S153]